MPAFSKKRTASMADSDASEPDLPVKAAKKAKNTATTAQPDGKDDEGNPFWELSNKRRVGVSQFKKMSFINIREYYEKDGKMLPGKKGISLSVEQYQALLKTIPGINAALRELGQPVEDIEETTSTALVSTKKTRKERNKSDKANIEATSDEDEG